MPSPRPLFEIYVHSRRLEGIHLRGGKVARGGIRWSDRHDDFRTEILGLMKTQMVKNSVIVPVGSKGGFVLKGEVPPRPALDEYLIDRYREFVSGLLDVTDNRADGKVLHPPEVVRLDGDDPYLVVAADKGTAHLSDTANSVSAQYGFWLGDAFASGRQRGLRPQEDGHHRARRVGVREAPLPQPRDRRPDAADHGGRRRRHVGRRVRQRRAAVARDQAGRGLRPPQHLHRPRPRPGGELPRARADVRARALELAGLRHQAAERGRRHLRPLGQGDPALRRGAPPARHRGRGALGRGGDPQDPDRPRRPALQRRHRDLRQGRVGGARPGRRPRQRPRPGQRARAAGPRGGRGRQPRAHAEGPARVLRRRRAGSTPTRSTTRAASTPPTTR